MTNAKLHGLLAPEQYRSRKSLMAIDHVINKRLTFDILRQKRLPGALCAKTMPNPAMTESYILLSPCVCGDVEFHRVQRNMFKTIQNLRHHVTTAYKTSEQCFGGSDGLNPSHGVEQGCWRVSCLNAVHYFQAPSTIVFPVLQLQTCFIFLIEMAMVVVSTAVQAGQVTEVMSHGILAWTRGGFMNPKTSHNNCHHAKGIPLTFL